MIILAAMRLRQLATTQSVTFFAPPEVYHSILDVCEMHEGSIPNSSDVIMWLLEQTCRANEHLQNLYIAQGSDFCRRKNAEWGFTNLFANPQQMIKYASVLQLPERQTLDQLYGCGSLQAEDSSPIGVLFPKLDTFVQSLNHRKRDLNHSLTSTYVSALEEVEQEREIEFQVEEVREVRQPPHRNALVFPGLHASISRFVETGYLNGREGYVQSYMALQSTTVGDKYNVCNTNSRLYVSSEFMRTVDNKKREPSDNFLVSQNHRAINV